MLRCVHWRYCHSLCNQSSYCTCVLSVSRLNDEFLHMVFCWNNADVKVLCLKFIDSFELPTLRTPVSEFRCSVIIIVIIVVLEVVPINWHLTQFMWRWRSFAPNALSDRQQVVTIGSNFVAYNNHWTVWHSLAISTWTTTFSIVERLISPWTILNP